jgi:protease-4
MTTSAKWFLGILSALVLASVLLTALFVALLRTQRDSTELVASGTGDKVALVEVKGVIVDAADVVRQLKKYREDASVRAIVLRIDSPGGGVVASQEMYEELRKTRDGGTPVVASMGSLAASGGYYIACACSVIVANPGTLTGSIGVISEFLQLEEALAKLGVGMKTVKAGALKDAGNPARAMTPDDERYFQGLMDEVHVQFKDVVARERGIDPARLDSLADGRVYTGTQALAHGLVDTLGTYEDAIALAGSIAGIDGEPGVLRERRKRSWWEPMVEEVADGLSEVTHQLLVRPPLSYRFSAY